MCKDPEKAFENWMERDRLFGQEILRQAKLYGYGTIVVDGKQGIEAQFNAVVRYYRLVGK